jgi:hypothetical protein
VAIAFDSAVDGGTNGGGANSLTFTFNNVAGNIVFVGGNGDSDILDVTSVTWNGVAMALVERLQGGLSSLHDLYLYVSNGTPATGSNNVVVSATNNQTLRFGAVSYSGASLFAQPDAHTNHFDFLNPLTTPLVSIADNCWHVLVFDGFHSGAEAPAAGTGTTRRAFSTDTTWGLFDSNSAKTPAGSVSLATQFSTIEQTAAHVMASFNPTAIIPPAVSASAYYYKA